MNEREPALDEPIIAFFSGSRSRRGALRTGALAAVIGAFALPRSAAADATPAAGAAGGLLLVQGFSKGSLFPTQGDAGVPPYTLILWDAAGQGLVYVDRTSGAAGIAPFDALRIAIEAGEQPQAALVAPAADGSGAQQVWALQLVYGDPGSDPGAVTYQGEAIDEAAATAWLGMAPMALPEGPQDLATGYLLIAGLAALDLPEAPAVRIEMP